jgi:YfiH family protein
VASLQLIPFAFDGSDVRAVVTTRHGGFSSGAYDSLNLGDHVGDDHDAVTRNREAVADALGVDAITFPDQQHKGTCALVTEDVVGRGFAGVDESTAYFAATDGLVTNVRGAALGIMVADCAPVLFWDPYHRAIGAAHAGRGGVVEGIIKAVVSRMRQEFGTDPSSLRVGIGPSIGFDSYEVGQVEADSLDALYPDASLTKPSRPGRFLLDVGGAVERQLADLGVPSDNVERLMDDTKTSTDTYFSDRAERPCGRFAGIIALPPLGIAVPARP